MHFYLKSMIRLVLILLPGMFAAHLSAGAGETSQKIHVVAFYTAKEDPAHISNEWQNRMVGEALMWLGEASSKSNR